MRLERLILQNFAGIDRADIAFGPRLNVLYGPNDLGKSRVAKAIRAALLLPASSSEGRRLVTWNQTDPAHVALVFADRSGKYWKVSKVFGEGSGAGISVLAYSKDGTTFQADEYKGRQVDEKIRELLRWGIPSPGGKGAPRGLPASFLTHVLLAEQTEVDTLFKKSLRDDGDAGGQVHLKEVLQVLAHDPALKKVLDVAQAHVDRYFTPKGLLTRAKGSRLLTLRQELTELESERQALQKRHDESAQAEHHLVALRDVHAETRDKLAEAESRLAETRVRRRQCKALEDAVAQRDVAQKALDEIDGQLRTLQTKEREIEALTKASESAKHAVDAARQAHEKARADHQAAEEALRRAKSDEGAHEREARCAELRAELVRAESREREAQLLHEKASAALAAEKALRDATESEKRAASEVAKATALAEQTEKQAQELETDIKLREAVLAYGGWRAAADAGKQAELELNEVESLRVRAKASEESAALEEAKILTSVPSSSEIEELDARDKEVAMAAARLEGVGLSVHIRPTRDLRIVVRTDGTERTVTAANGTLLEVEASRTVGLAIEDVAEINVTAGSAEHRQALDAARAKWAERVGPALARAGVESVAELRVARKTTDDARSAAQRLRDQAGQLRAQAELREGRIAELRGRAGNATALAEGFAGVDRTILEAHLAKMGERWEAETSRTLRARKTELHDVRAKNEAARRSGAVEESRLEQTRGIVAERKEALATATALIGDTPDKVLAQASSEAKAAVADKQKITKTLAALQNAANQAVSEAEKVLTAAKEALAPAAAREDGANATLKTAERAHAEAVGGAAQLGSFVATLDRDAAAARVAQCDEAIASLPRPEPLVSDEDVRAAEAACEAAKTAVASASNDLAKAQGALESVGGHVVREQLESLDAAIAAQKALQQETELDAYGWRLLAETLKSVQADQGVHLGRELSRPVTKRLSDLTGGRYGIELGPHLEPHRIDGMSGDEIDEVLESFSVGTREQLATLVRIALAEQLKSAILLDDHLVQTDPTRLEWFRDHLRRAAQETQLVILTCRPQDYLTAAEMPEGAAVRDIAAGLVRAVDLSQLVVSRRRTRESETSSVMATSELSG